MDVKWDSVKWPDGSTYEGLVRDEKCDVRGVFSYPNGNRYEGEFMENHMDGYGVFVWTNGTIYRGEWQKSKMQGCGVKLARYNGKNGVSFTAEEGHFMDDEWVGDVMACSVEQSRAAAYEADMAAKMARAFEVSQRVKPSDMVATRADGSAGGPSLRVAKEAAQVAARDEGKRWFGIF